jgi:alanyl-tRNA synthetase
MPISPQLLYIQDPFMLEFEASVVEKVPLPGGHLGVILDRTYFYPTGGGQEHDTGQIGDAVVLEVQKSKDNSTVIHVLDRDIPVGRVTARIDSDRRIRHMQHHTAQHLLSQCFLRQLNAPTVSANINGYSPSTLDLDFPPISKTDLQSVEFLANEVIFQNLQVKSYFVSKSESTGLPIRKADAVHEELRIVEIDSFDFSACAGTHCTQTGSIGIMKITRTERQNDKLRVHFIAGKQALETFMETFDAVNRLSAAFSVHPRELETAVLQQSQVLDSVQKRLGSARHELLKLEALQLFRDGETIQQRLCVLGAYEDRPLEELRFLALDCCRHPRTLALFSSLTGSKISLVVGCSPGGGVKAGQLLQALLKLVGGRGGGDDSFGQGGGSGDSDQQAALMQNAYQLLKTLPPPENAAG